MRLPVAETFDSHGFAKTTLPRGCRITPSSSTSILEHVCVPVSNSSPRHIRGTKVIRIVLIFLRSVSFFSFSLIYTKQRVLILKLSEWSKRPFRNLRDLQRYIVPATFFFECINKIYLHSLLYFLHFHFSETSLVVDTCTRAKLISAINHKRIHL